MISTIKSIFATVSMALGAEFQSLSYSELEDFAQNYTFESPLINLSPILSVDDNIMISGAVRSQYHIDLFFLTEFKKDDNMENVKDFLIDNMLSLKTNFFRRLNLDQSLYFLSTGWTWKTEIVRQHTSNLLCGCRCKIILDSTCSVVSQTSFDYELDLDL